MTLQKSPTTQKTKSFPLRLDPLTNNPMTHALGDGLRKGMFLPPTIDKGTYSVRYRFRDFWRTDIRPEDVEFGHKVFRLPTFRLACLKRIDRSISPKLRIILSFMVIYRHDKFTTLACYNDQFYSSFKNLFLQFTHSPGPRFWHRCIFSSRSKYRHPY